MTKSNPKINLLGKDMNLLEAKLCLCGLKLGIMNANLSEEEETDYLKWKEDKKIRNERAKELIGEYIFKKVGKKEYIVEILERKIDAAKVGKKIKYCEKHGHKKRKNYTHTFPAVEGAIIHYYCSRCGMFYE